MHPPRHTLSHVPRCSPHVILCSRHVILCCPHVIFCSPHAIRSPLTRTGVTWQRHVLSAPYIFEEFDSDAITELLTRLTPARVTVFHMSKAHQAEAAEREPYYGTAFKVEDIRVSALVAVGLRWPLGSLRPDPPLPTTRSPTPHDQVPTPHYQIPHPHYRSLTTHYQIPHPHYQIPTTHY